MKPSIALIGPGKVGCAVAKRLQMANYPIVAVIGRDLERTADGCRFIGCPIEAASTDLKQADRAEVILLAVPDDQISETANNLGAQLKLSVQKTLIHFSGLHLAAIMRTERSATATLSIHPLLPFANRQIASEQLIGCACGLEGDDESISLGIELITAFNGLPVQIASDKKALYHASACIASNFFVTLQAMATEILVECGIEAKQATSLLLPLVQASLDNVAKLGPGQGLTGPIVRGDSETVVSHLSALNNSPANSLEIYKLLGERTVLLAEKSTRLSKKQAETFLKILTSSPNDKISKTTTNPEKLQEQTPKNHPPP